MPRGWNALVQEIRATLTEAIAAGGSSLRDYRQADGALGYFQHGFKVYGREGAACQRCRMHGHVRRIVQSGRSSFYCAAARDDLNPLAKLISEQVDSHRQGANMAYETLIVDIKDHVALIRLNRPDAMNALNTKLLPNWPTPCSAADANDKVRCMVLTGSDKAFAAGADVKEMADKSFVAAYQEDLFGPPCDAIAAVRKPVIAAVAGYALGGGCELAMMCDFIIAADTAKFGQPEINLGIVAGMGGTQRLTRLVGMSKAMDMHLTGRFMDAEEAERAGLVSRVVPAKKLTDEAMSAAGKIAEKSQITVKAVKESVNRAYEGSLREGLLFERRMFHMSSRQRTGPKACRRFLKSAHRNFATSDCLFSFRARLPIRRAHARGPA